MTGSIRIAAAIAAACVFLASATRTPAQQPARTPTIEDLQLVEIEVGDSQLRKLLKERFNLAVEEVRAVNALYRRGRITLDELAGAIQRFAKAGVDLAQKPAERISYLELALAQAKMIETAVGDRHAQGGASLDQLLRAKGLRVDAEIALVRERAAAR